MTIFSRGAIKHNCPKKHHLYNSDVDLNGWNRYPESILYDAQTCHDRYLIGEASKGKTNNKRMVEFSARYKVTVILAYYPPYHSKYKPNEQVGMAGAALEWRSAAGRGNG